MEINFGYARVSRKSQELPAQVAALEKVGCTKIFQEKKSGRKEREGYTAMISEARIGDTITVTEITRLGRTTLELIRLLVDLSEKGINIVSIREGIDTRTRIGKVFYQFAAVLSGNEIEQVEERSNDAREYAAQQGRKGGRPPGLSPQAQKTADMVLILYQQNQSIADIRKTLKIGSNTTVYRYLENARQRNGLVENHSG